MKEFIEKLIGRLEEKENETVLKAPNTSDISNTEYQKWMMKSYGFKESIEIVNQLAEEHNNDFCEWHKVKNGNVYKCNTHAEIHDSRVLDWCVCPYCSKKIKVVD